MQEFFCLEACKNKGFGAAAVLGDIVNEMSTF